MITKQNLRKFKKVDVIIAVGKDNKFSNGKKSHRIKVYDATPEEVLNVVQTAIEKQ